MLLSSNVQKWGLAGYGAAHCCCCCRCWRMIQLANAWTQVLQAFGGQCLGCRQRRRSGRLFWMTRLAVTTPGACLCWQHPRPTSVWSCIPNNLCLDRGKGCSMVDVYHTCCYGPDRQSNRPLHRLLALFGGVCEGMRTLAVRACRPPAWSSRPPSESKSWRLKWLKERWQSLRYQTSLWAQIRRDR